MEHIHKINAAQYEVLNLLSCIDREEDIADLKNVLVQFLNSRLQKELDRMIERGELTDEKMSEWKNEHMRTPYKRLN